MKVTMLTYVSTVAECYVEGQEYDLPDLFAKHLVDAEYAVASDGEPVAPEEEPVAVVAPKKRRKSKDSDELL